MTWGDRPPPTPRNDPPMWTSGVRFQPSDLAAIKIELQAAQQAIRETKRDVDLLWMLFGTVIFLGVLIAVAVGVVVWGMR